MKRYLIFILGLMILSIYSCQEEDINNPQHEHYEAFGMNIYFNNKLYMKILNAEIDNNYNESFLVNINSEPEFFNVVFLDENGEELKNPEDDEMNLGFLIGDTSIVKAYIWDESKWYFVLKGEKKGSTTIEIRLNHIDHPDFKTPQIPVVVE